MARAKRKQSSIEVEIAPDKVSDHSQKKVGVRPTFEVPANVAEFRDEVAFLVRCRGYEGPDPDSAARRARKGCQKFSRPTAPTGSLVDLRENMPAATPPHVYEHFRDRWYEGQEDRQELTLTGYIPSADLPYHEGRNRDRAPMMDLRGVWRPTQPASARPLRGAMYRLRDDIRAISQPRCQACGRAVVCSSGQVAVLVTPDGRVKLSGLAHCGSVWECPTCQMQILQARAEQVSTGVERHGKTRVAMLTLTIRHAQGDSLKRMRTLLVRTWGAMLRHRQFKKWQRDAGVVGFVRAVEVKHGPNGWHPHLHVLFFFDDDVPTAYAPKKNGGFRSVWDCPDFEALTGLWRHQVQYMFGKSFAGIGRVERKHNDKRKQQLAAISAAGAPYKPTPKRALKATLASDGEYIAKLGLELSDPALKSGHTIGDDGKVRRTPFAIAQDYADAARIVNSKRMPSAVKRDAMLTLATDKHLWRTYCADMRGAQRLVWSNGLKAMLDIVELPDEIILEEEEAQPGDRLVGTIPAATWNAIRDERISGNPMSLHLLQVAEAGGAAAFDRELLRVAAGEHRAR